MLVVPRPMLVLFELVSGGVVAAKAGFGHFGATGERALKFFELGVIRGGFAACFLPELGDGFVDRAGL